ncbi:MAG: autotransporter domain-containing protein, partial [Bacteroidetes bacterium SB0662_bin_6]|nr:autotransporter domain-containing protein [Bacteroidetes bacterium SB0662_bin_6]
RFAVGAEDGVITYVGPGEDFETGPEKYDLTLRARDTAGAEAQAEIEVVVTDVNEAPEFAQGVYRVELAENLDGRNRPVELLRLTAEDPDGDALTYDLASGDPDRFAVGAEDGVVTYVGPGEDFETGPEGYDLTLRARDGAGAQAQAEIVVVVTDANEAPVAVGVIPDQTLDEGGGAAEVDLSPFFDDADGDGLTYHAESSDPRVVSALVTAALLTLTPGMYGSAMVKVTSEDPGGLSTTQSFRVGVSDMPQRAIIEHMLAATARSHLASVRMTLDRRMNAGPCEPSRLTVMGRSAPLGEEAARGVLGQFATVARGRTTDPSLAPGAADRLTPAQLLGLGGGRAAMISGTEFLLAGGDGDRNGCTGLRRWSLWGQGDVQTFSGTPSVQGYESGYDGELRTGYLGLDVRLRERWMAGLAISRSRGAGDWRVGASDGELTQTMTAVHPYLRWAGRSTSLWASVGGGRGNAENLRTAGRLGTSATALRLGLVELKRRLGAPGGLDFALMGDASWAALRTEDGEESVDGQNVRVNQVRIGADLSLPVQVAAAAVTFFGEVYARTDGGAGQTGQGIEVAAGSRAVLGIVSLDARARTLALHSAAGYAEQGIALALTVGRPGAEGLSFSVSPRWGDAAAGAGSLWRSPLHRGSRSAFAGRDRWTLDVRGNYNIGLSPGGRRLDLYGAWNPALGGSSFGLSLGAARHE